LLQPQYSRYAVHLSDKGNRPACLYEGDNIAAAIKQLTIQGFKSIQNLENFELRDLNVLIGANGAGKSNFIELFRMLREMVEGRLQSYVAKAGGGDGLFFGGPKTTPQIHLIFDFGQNNFKITLEPTADSRVLISKEFIGHPNDVYWEWSMKGAGFESHLKSQWNDEESAHFDGIAHFIYGVIAKWAVYHFHDTGALSPMRRDQSLEDAAYLRSDASNVASFLRAMRDDKMKEYSVIRDTIRLVAPFFDDFLLKEKINGNEKKVALDWRQKGSDFPFQPWHLSDGTLRFICLATALLQPNPPPTIVIDEPELGLHPHALEVLAGLLQKASQRVQVIVSTQSAPLLSQFEPEDVITVSRKNGASTFGRLDKSQLTEWMKDYTLGELWQKNVIEAGATND
jgi:predicted ATPase